MSENGNEYQKQKGGQEEEAYYLRTILGINKNVLQTQVMEIDSKLVRLPARALQEWD